MQDKLTEYLERFENTEEFNDFIYERFTAVVNEIEFLKAHRDFIEKKSLGFGDRAFHFMWYLIIADLIQKDIKLSFLEIGVFKGQVISLWALIAKQLNRPDIEITGITPLEGKTKVESLILRRIKMLISKKYREDEKNGNFYESVNYYSIIKSLFDHFLLDFSRINIIKGYSTEDDVIHKANNMKYSLIYIDGDHSYTGVMSDIKNYSSMLAEDGYFVMDDASCHIPGTKFWKGHLAVSDACKRLPEFGFKNVLNVGHNRVYQKAKYEFK